MKKLLSKILCLSFMFPGLALAHPGHEHATGYIHGFSHPLGGLDHILAMIAVGLWAAQTGGRAIWIVPCTFVGVMVAGGVLGITGVAVPFVEGGILVSILVFGILIAGAFKLPLFFSSLIVGLFAVFHGHAHGAEMQESLGAVSYAMGFAIATAILHAVGIGIGAFMQKSNLQIANRLAGIAIVFGGIYVAIG